MKEPAKDFNQFSESEMIERSHADGSCVEHQPNLLSTKVDKNENEEPSLWKRFFKGYSQFYDRIKPILNILWIVTIIFLVTSHLGALIIARSSTPQELPTSQEHSEIIFNEWENTKPIFVSQTLDRPNIESNQIQINTEILDTLDYAYRKAEARAEKKLDSWIEDLMFRVDEDFLNWHFNFFNKKWREDSALITWVLGGNVKESQEQAFIEQFSKLVVSKTEAEQKIVQITNDAAETYVDILKHKFDRIEFKYNIPENQWNEYLNNITFNLPGTGNTTLAEISAVGAYPLVKAIVVPSLAKVSILGASKITAVAGAKYAAKLGLKAAGETTISTFTKVADPLLLVGFIFYEVGDHYATVAEQKSALHDSIFETFKEIEDDILYDHNSGVMTTLYYIENNIRNSIILKANSQRNISIPTIQS